MPISLGDLFESRMEPEPMSGCWLWIGGQFSNGYGRLCVNGSDQGAHRVSYRLHVGEIPFDMELDHLCRVRLCVNPRHLEPVSHHENVLRGNGFSGRRARQTHCIHGHEFTQGNTYRRLRNGRMLRQCLVCMARVDRARGRKWMEGHGPGL